MGGNYPNCIVPISKWVGFNRGDLASVGSKCIPYILGPFSEVEIGLSLIMKADIDVLVRQSEQEHGTWPCLHS